MAFYFLPCKRPHGTVRHQRGSLASVTDTTNVTAASPRADARPRVGGWASHLRRHLRWVIGIKLLLIFLLFSLFFSSSHRPSIDAARVSDRLQLGR